MSYNIILRRDALENYSQEDYDDLVTVLPPLAQTFQSKDEMKSFLISLAEVHPNGITFDYFHQKVNMYRSRKIYAELFNLGYAVSQYNDEGDEQILVSDEGMDYIKKMGYAT